MRTSKLLAGLLGISLSLSVHAVPVNYNFSGVTVAEFLDFTSSAITDPSQRLYSDGVSGNLDFTYDSDTPVNTSDNVPFPQILGFGTCSDYIGAGSVLSGNLGSDAFSADGADVIVADAPGSGGFLDGFFMSSGQLESGPVNGNNLVGFSVSHALLGDFDLTGFTFFTTSFQNHFLSQSLPGEILNGQLLTGLNLRFVSQVDPQIQRIVQVAGTVTRISTSVPEPMSLALMLLGTLLLGVRRIND